MAAATAAPAERAPDAAALLRAALTAPSRVSYVGQMETLRFTGRRADAAITRVDHRAPAQTRRWYLAPQSLYGDYSITSGATTYEVDVKAANVTVRSSSPADTEIDPESSLALVLQNYRAIVVEGDSLVGRRTYVVTLVNRHTGERALRLTIDRETDLVLERVAYHGNGSVASQSRFEALRYTTAIPRELFDVGALAGFTRTIAPADDRTTDVNRLLTSAGFKTAIPRYLPQGFTLVGGSIGGPQGVRTLHLFYSDGLMSLSLFESPARAAVRFGTLTTHAVRVGENPGEYSEDGPSTLVTWRDEGLSYAIVGDLPRAQLTEIAASIDR